MAGKIILENVVNEKDIEHESSFKGQSNFAQWILYSFRHKVKSKKTSPNPLLTTFIEMRDIKKYTIKCNSAGYDFARKTRQIYAIVLYLARNSEVKFLELIFHLKIHPYNCRVSLKSRDTDSVLNPRRKYCLLNHQCYFLRHLAFSWKLSTWADLNLFKLQTPVKVAVKPM